MRRRDQGDHKPRRRRRGNRRRPQKSRRPDSFQGANEAPTVPVEGLLEVLPEGYGFLRQPKNCYQSDQSDTQVPQSVVDKNGLRSGCEVKGLAVSRKGKTQLRLVESIGGEPPEKYAERTPFTSLTSIDPYERLEIDRSNDLSMRILDLVTPIGKGQRGLIVASPRTGKTVLLQKLANSIAESHPEIQLMILLVDERPEEVTEMRRSTSAEVVHSSNDHSPKRHIKVVEMVLRKARRLVESGKDVVILLDSLTRVARAYNTQSKGSGRTLSGGLDSNTMRKPREFFGAARKLEEGGSLTIIATALVDTGSRMDQVIFEEFKGTGNMELFLHRPLADRREWPAIDIHKSGTRKEEKLRAPEDQRKIDLLRRVLADSSTEEALQLLRSRLEKTPNNREFMKMMNV